MKIGTGFEPMVSAYVSATVQFVFLYQSIEMSDVFPQRLLKFRFVFVYIHLLATFLLKFKLMMILSPRQMPTSANEHILHLFALILVATVLTRN